MRRFPSPVAPMASRPWMWPGPTSCFALFRFAAFFTPALYAIEERELILDIFEAVSGSRMMCNYFRFGGVARDLPNGTYEKIKALL